MTEAQQPQAALGDENVETYEDDLLQAVDIPEDERQRILRDLSLTVRELEEVEAEKKQINADFNQRIKDLKGHISKLAEEGRLGTREEKVRCRLVKNFYANEITATRLDTGAVAEGYPRTMTAEELQRGLDIGGPDEGDEPPLPPDAQEE